MRNDLIALFAFEQDGDEINVVSEKHYQLVPPEAVTDCARRSESEPKRRSVFDPPGQYRGRVAEAAVNGEGVRGRGEICLWISG